MNKSSQHVVPSPNGGWAVRSAGALRASRTFVTQSEAVRYGRKVAQNSLAVLYVHGRDGTVVERNSYGHDPFPVPNKRD